MQPLMFKKTAEFRWIFRPLLCQYVGSTSQFKYDGDPTQR